MSSEKNLGCLGYMGNEILHSYMRITINPLEGSLLNNQYFMESKARPGFLNVAHKGFKRWCEGFGAILFQPLQGGHPSPVILITPISRVR